MIFFLVYAPIDSFAQPPVEDNAYLFPIRPGERNFLAGTMGEMRGSHFHGGLDVRTGGRIGLPVYATQSGYISRIQVSTGGYGHVLYLSHDDGNISVYAHLNLFEAGLEKYLRTNQYKEESYEIRLFPEKNQFRFKTGEILGYSGNTGSSLGPHLHFEIRDNDHRFLNPQEFGFSEIVDNIPPLIKSIGFVTRSPNSRVNGLYGRYDFEVIKVNGKFTTRKPIVLEGEIGVEIFHYDNHNGSYSRNGIPEIVFFLDGDTVFHQVKDRMSFNKNRNILVHLDYPVYRSKGRKFNKLYLEDGNELDIYKETSRSIPIDSNPHDLRIVLRDNDNNFSEFQATVNRRKVVYPELPEMEKFEILGNQMHFSSTDSIAKVFFHYRSEKIKSYKSFQDIHYFIWDLRNALPDSIRTAGSIIDPKFYAMIPSGFNFSFYNGDFDFETSKKTLFDTLFLRFEKNNDSISRKEIFDFKNTTDPLRNNVTITLKPNNSYGDKASVYSINRSKLSYVSSKRQSDGSFQFKTRELGKFTIAYDSIPPIITPVNWSKTNLKVKIEDESSGVKKYRATLDGRFLLMRFESKKGLLMAQPIDPNKPLSGEFILEVEDNLGNKNQITRKL